MIMRIIRWIISFFTRHKKGVIVGAAAIGGAGAGAGIFNAHKAKKINRQALDIQQNALERHEQAYQETQAVLALLGEVEKDAIDSFVHFADTMERIQGGPKYKSNIFSKVKMPNYEAEVSQYAVGYRDGEKVRQLEKRAVCSAEYALKLMNKCRLLSWDGYHGKHSKGIKDGTNFILKATVNEGKEIYATGSQRFPRHYGDFRDGLREMLNNK